ncbi:MAG: hypothetical protein HKN23_10250 [Verrucomicrobiales bacterium]|nr:hypothetical protein [Verrucomicrobiales bacterium]
MTEIPTAPSETPAINRRRSPFGDAAIRVFGRLWRRRYVHLTALGYIVLLVLFWREFLSIPSGQALSNWSPPNETHPFGVNALGQDMLKLSLAGGAKSMTVALVGAALGVGAGILASWLVVISGRRIIGFWSLTRISHWGTFTPAFSVLVLIAVGLRPGFWLLAVLLAGVIFIATVARIARWFEDLELRGDTIAGTVLGFTSIQVVNRNHLPVVIRRGIALSCSLVPGLVLGETALSFIGLGLVDGSWGKLIADGREVVFEAPWLLIYPGLVASLSLFALASLGWMARRSMNGELPPRVF